jgi:hypothetical protein
MKTKSDYEKLIDQFALVIEKRFAGKIDFKKLFQLCLPFSNTTHTSCWALYKVLDKNKNKRNCYFDNQIMHGYYGFIPINPKEEAFIFSLNGEIYKGNEAIKYWGERITKLHDVTFGSD